MNGLEGRGLVYISGLGEKLFLVILVINICGKKGNKEVFRGKLRCEK